MTRLADIPVVMDDGGLTGSAPAVLREVAALLETLCRTGETASIDLRGLPLSLADRRWLLERLGKGEVDIALDIGGGSRIAETAYPGVWWVTHDNEQGVQVGEFIEVSYVPELLAPHPEDVENGLDSLKTRISELS
ncbi:MAG TPA: hydrogenase expression/formation C-terminal domain-containing protein [Parasulfuritortus sp.]